MLTDVLNDLSKPCLSSRLSIKKSSQVRNLKRLSYDPLEELRIARMYRRFAEESARQAATELRYLLMCACGFAIALMIFVEMGVIGYVSFETKISCGIVILAGMLLFGYLHKDQIFKK